MTKHDHTTLTVICRHLAIKVTKTLDINIPGKKNKPAKMKVKTVNTIRLKRGHLVVFQHDRAWE